VEIRSNQAAHLISQNLPTSPTCIYHCSNELVYPSVHLATALRRCTNSTRKGSSLDVHAIHCPSCGEPLDVAIDWSVNHQEYIEDCQVCCRPMVLQITVDEERNAEIAVRVETTEQKNAGLDLSRPALIQCPRYQRELTWVVRSRPERRFQPPAPSGTLQLQTRPSVLQPSS
jgi:hypothetical protein